MKKAKKIHKPPVVEDPEAGRDGMEPTRQPERWTVKTCCIIIAIVLVVILLISSFIYFCLSANWSLFHFSKGCFLTIFILFHPNEITNPQKPECDILDEIKIDKASDNSGKYCRNCAEIMRRSPIAKVMQR
ncbi:hypothetical protein WR25_06215 [Diploscapter pachys]|uniref:Uncharacterized protein n=1 Tax=Diploscapter pachys TaxID=2018661 RepID=A0A2A2M099_9BILA|nr:hypothetical protein WR25_06215 [Diploscapter pachys]